MRGPCLAALFLGVLVSRAAADGPDYSAFRSDIFLPFLKSGSDRMPEIPHLHLALGGRQVRATLDTGSTGIVVSASSIPGLAKLQSLGDGRVTYTSSARIMLGKWVVTSVTISGRDGSSATTDPLPVLAVTEVACTAHARDCTPTTEPDKIAMIGIGFAREADAQRQGTPDRNPLLHVAGEERHGWVLTRDGIHVGLSAGDTAGMVRYVKLARQTDFPDWEPVPACISLDGKAPPACGSMLLDTGVTAMFMTVPASQAGSQSGALADGTRVSIRLGSDGAGGELYGFTIGSDSPLAPEGTHLTVRPDRVFVNTSFHLLNGFDLIYDADGGYAGFRRR